MNRSTCPSPTGPSRSLRRGLMALTLGLGVVLSGCASGPYADPRDPFEPFNRRMSDFNDGLDRAVLKPTATAYKAVLPDLVRTGVNNFFSNLGEVWSFVNNALQFKGQAAAETFMRFSVNTVFGFAGVLDIASEMGIERHKEDFGQTLGRWGVPPGPYVVLPLFGPSTLRDTVALPVDRAGDPVTEIDPVRARNATYALRVVDLRAGLLRAGNVLEDAALDKYSFTRDAYLQLRRAQVRDGRDADDGSDTDGALPAEPLQAPVARPASTPAR